MIPTFALRRAYYYVPCVSNRIRYDYYQDWSDFNQFPSMQMLRIHNENINNCFSIIIHRGWWLPLISPSAVKTCWNVYSPSPGAEITFSCVSLLCLYKTYTKKPMKMKINRNARHISHLHQHHTARILYSIFWKWIKRLQMSISKYIVKMVQ